MKRVQAACIMQTLLFSQKPEYGYSKDRALALNREEYEQYQAKLSRNKIRYQIASETETPEGALLVRVRKQYNDMVDVTEYFA